MSALFQGDPKKPVEVRYDEFYRDFNLVVNEGGAPKTGTRVTQSYNILFTVVVLLVDGSLTSPTGSDALSFDVQLPEQEEFWTIFESEVKNISEIFVHVLDLHYFYGSRVHTYVTLIWTSWATVPNVIGDLRQYIMRTLLAISAGTDGSSKERFNLAIQRLNEILSGNPVLAGLPVVQDVLAFIFRQEKRDSLVRPFLRVSFWSTLLTMCCFRR